MNAGRVNGVAVEGAPIVAELYTPRRELLLSTWLTRKLPPRDHLLGDVFCTTSRWEIVGDTGVGKTLFALAMAGAIGSGKPFLNWDGRHPCRVMYLDGELPAETFKERMQLIAEEFGSDIQLYGYNRDVLGPDDMPPLNTEEGEKWLWREIEAVKPDAIFFDSIMCLLAGVMSEEESWTRMKPIIHKLSARRIGQVWLHHTGHDKTKGFGTKTREWQLDTVLMLTAAKDGGESIGMEFTKARLRTPATKDQFSSRIIRREPEGWKSDGAFVASKGARGRSAEVEQIKSGIIAAYNRLADGVETSPGLDGSPVRKVLVDKLRDEVRSRGFLDVTEKGQLTDTSRTHFRRAKTGLLDAGRLIERDDHIWRPALAPRAAFHVSPLKG